MGMRQRRTGQGARRAAGLLCLGMLLLTGGCESEGGEESAAYADGLVISELMPKNRATLADAAGAFPDWIELYNGGTEHVKLSGWTLNDGDTGPGWRLPDGELAPGAYLLLFAGGEAAEGDGAPRADFSLSAGETVTLRAPDGTRRDSAPIPETEADQALIRNDGGGFRTTGLPTPGQPNTREGYLRALAERETDSPLVINEVLVRNGRFLEQFRVGFSDIVELKNVSDRALRLGDYSVADKSGARCALPDIELAPGGLFLLFCSGDSGNSAEGFLHADFALNARSERLYLYGKGGALADYMALHDIPAGGSYGRMEGGTGLFYFAEPSPGAENREGRHFVAARPVTATQPGVYEDTEELTVTLEADPLALPGEEEGLRIRYTTDGSMPDENAPLYTGPLRIRETTILRAVAVGEDTLPSRAATFSYMLNENLHLPLLSVTVDDFAQFRTLYFAGSKNHELSANAAFFDGEHSFNKDCAISMKGWTSLSLPKKSMGLAFKDSIDGPLEAEVFEGGPARFSDLSVRAGQDNLRTLFRTELIQDLALESSEHLLVQRSRFCVLFLNGEYWGVYALKEDLTREYYAQHYGVSRESVEVVKGEAALDSAFYREVIAYAAEHDMADAEHYARLCRVMDMDSFIDWIIFEGYSGNSDTLNNIRFFRSSEGDGLWRWALYDLDWAFYGAEMDFAVIMNSEYNAGYQMTQLMMDLFENEDFKGAFLRRFGELNRTTLSNRHVLEAIDGYVRLLEPEIARDGKLRQSSYDSWLVWVDELRSFITDFDRENHNVTQIAKYLKMSEEEVRAAMAG